MGNPTFTLTLLPIWPLEGSLYAWKPCYVLHLPRRHFWNEPADLGSLVASPTCYSSGKHLWFLATCFIFCPPATTLKENLWEPRKFLCNGPLTAPGCGSEWRADSWGGGRHRPLSASPFYETCELFGNPGVQSTSDASSVYYFFQSCASMKILSVRVQGCWAILLYNAKLQVQGWTKPKLLWV